MTTNKRLTLFMVALIKDTAITPREDQMTKRNGRSRMAQQPGPRLRQAQHAFKATPGAGGTFPNNDEGPELEEASNGKEIFEAEVEEGLTALAEVEAEERVHEPRSRTRSSYDGETAFRLYLREIGDIKL